MVDNVDAAVELIVDAEDLITAIEVRPELWDIENDDYSNREIRRQKWEEIVEAFLRVKNATPEMKIIFGKMLQRKWKSLRDCYSRERQRVAKLQNGETPERKKAYVFSKQMSFLEKVMKSRSPGSITSSVFEVVKRPAVAAKEERLSDEEIPFTCIAPDTRQDASSSVQDTNIPVRIRYSKSRKREIPHSKSDIDFIDNVQRTDEYIQSDNLSDRENGEKLFLLSLVGPMQKIPEHLRFGIRLQIMQVISNALYGDRSNNQPMDTEKSRDCWSEN